MLTIKEVSEMTGLAVSTLYNYRHIGRGPESVRDGRFVRFPRAGVEAWIAERKARPGKRRGRPSRATAAAA